VLDNIVRIYLFPSMKSLVKKGDGILYVLIVEIC
jgi:hypothetical protein